MTTRKKTLPVFHHRIDRAPPLRDLVGGRTPPARSNPGLYQETYPSLEISFAPALQNAAAATPARPTRPGLGRRYHQHRGSRRLALRDLQSPPNLTGAAPTLCLRPPLPPPLLSVVDPSPPGREGKEIPQKADASRQAVSARVAEVSPPLLLHSLPHLPAHRFLRFLPCPAREKTAASASVAQTSPPPTPPPGRPQGRVEAPVCIRKVTPTYPTSLRNRGVGGVVVLAITVDEIGRVTCAEVHRSSGNPTLDRSACSGVLRWKYRPARREGLAIASATRVNVVFRPS